MPDENPYQSDHRKTIEQAPSPLPLVWSGLTVLACTIAFGGLGLAVGLTIAAVAPDYYRTMFYADTDPFSMGFGLGLTQGAGGGAAIGILLVALFYWYRSRVSRTR